jgi:hypothetical protein
MTSAPGQLFLKAEMEIFATCGGSWKISLAGGGTCMQMHETAPCICMYVHSPMSPTSKQQHKKSFGIIGGGGQMHVHKWVPKFICMHPTRKLRGFHGSAMLTRISFLFFLIFDFVP